MEEEGNFHSFICFDFLEKYLEKITKCKTAEK
jgi:hypothetical protein